MLNAPGRLAKMGVEVLRGGSINARGWIDPSPSAQEKSPGETPPGLFQTVTTVSFYRLSSGLASRGVSPMNN